MKLKEKIKDKLDNKFNKYKYYRLYEENHLFKVLVFTLISSFISFGFGVFNLVYGIVLYSYRYLFFSIYYFVIGLMKLLIILVYKSIFKKYKEDNVRIEKEKRKIYLFNGILFFILGVGLSFIVSMVLNLYKPIVTSEILAISIATYTFYKIVISIKNFVKAKRNKDKLIQSIRDINLIETITSLVLLESTLITTFGEMTNSLKIVVGVSGFILSLLIFSISIYIVISSISYFQKIKSKEKKIE